MILFFLICSIGLLVFLFNAKQTIEQTAKEKLDNQPRFFFLLHIVKIAPLIALILLFFLTLSWLQTKMEIRLTHAWFVAQFWAMTTFIYCSYMVTKRKSYLVPLVVSFFIAIYHTPLFHFETVAKGTPLLAINAFSTLTFVLLWIVSSAVRKKIKNK